MAMVKEDMLEGSLKERGSSFGEPKGYSGGEGTEVEIGSFIQRHGPSVSHKAHLVALASRVDEATRSLAK